MVEQSFIFTIVVFMEFVLWMNDIVNFTMNPCEYSRSADLVVYMIQFDIHEATFNYKSCDIGQ